MKILLCCPDPEDKKLGAFAARSFPSPAAFELIADSAFARSYKKKAGDSFVYFDATLGEKRIVELAGKIEELVGCAWGVIDKMGESPDPAAYFFAGASDYIGAQLFKSGLGQGRQAKALAFSGLAGSECEEAEGRSFPGWACLDEGADVPVRFCYAALGNQRALLENIGEKRLDKLREDFAAFLESWSKECGGIVWIRETAGCLLLFPPRDEGKNPVFSAFRLLLDRVIIGYEVFKLEVPLSFRFAFHAGHTMWKKPGATGSVVAEDVNFVFHLGMKAGVDGSILVSSEVERDIPPCLLDLFSSAGSFEGRGILSSRRFKN